MANLVSGILQSSSKVVSSALRSSLVDKVTRETLLSMDPEIAHRATILALKNNVVPLTRRPVDLALATNVAGLDFANPIGMAAGFDKNAEVVNQLIDVGFGFTEVGTLTPKPQKGNPKPRLFRMSDANGIINRMGFNNCGHRVAKKRLLNRVPRNKGILGVNIGANKTSKDFIADYVRGIKNFGDVADYFTINISSPNTPGLRDLQQGEALHELLARILDARANHKILHAQTVPIFLKIAPDVDPAQLDEICAKVLEHQLDGMVVSNTTTARKAVASYKYGNEKGGLSGQPMFALSTKILAQTRLRVGPDLPLIGVGGIHSPESAFAKFAAGANLIQLYSCLVYEGMGLVSQIKDGLLEQIAARGKDTIADCVSLDAQDWASGKATL